MTFFCFANQWTGFCMITAFMRKLPRVRIDSLALLKSVWMFQLEFLVGNFLGAGEEFGGLEFSSWSFPIPSKTFYSDKLIKLFVFFKLQKPLTVFLLLNTKNCHFFVRRSATVLNRFECESHMRKRFGYYRTITFFLIW